MIRLYNQNIWGNTQMPIGERNRLIREMIAEYQPDFCSLQECNPRTSRVGNDPMHEILADVYAEASRENQMRNFTPVFYKKDAWDLINSGFETYEGLNDGQSKSLTWAVLAQKSSGKRVCVVSTHFWYKNAAEEDFRQRIENVRQLKARCDALYAEFAAPIIVSGDLNCGKGSKSGEAPYFAMVEQGFEDIRHKAADTTDSFTIHHYPLQGADGLYFCTDKPSMTLDYIFTYGTHLTPEKFAVVTTDIALRSSDHCPLIGDFSF
ncbi:MAG: hypothetical protein E7463_13995 [Ruminococcaceae bacterium]|nr:hypothetical protein [Oscillospiraceae bacterium]